MRNFSPREKSIAICDGQAPEDGDLPQKCAERFLNKLSELEIQAEEWKTVPWVWEKFCNISDLFTLFGLKFWKVISFTRERSKRNLNLGPEFSVGAVRKWSFLSASFSHPLTKYACVLLWQRAEPWARSDAARSDAARRMRVHKNETELKHHRSWKPIHHDHCSCPEEVCCQLTSTAWTTVASRPSRSGS